MSQGGGEMGPNVVVVVLFLSGGILLFPNTSALLVLSFWDFGPVLAVNLCL